MLPRLKNASVLVTALLMLGACAASSSGSHPAASVSTIDRHYLTAADRYVKIDGVRYRVRDEGRAGAPAIVLIHGFSFSLETWDAWARGLAPDYRVVRFDLAGHGLSEPDPKGRYDAGTRVRHVVALMKHLGIRKATLVGNSYGGLLAWRIAAAYPALVDRLILVDSAAFSINGVTDRPAPVPPGMRAYLLDPKPAMVKGSAAIIFSNTSALTPERLDMMRDMIARPGNGPALVSHLEQFTLPAPEVQLASIQAPTLILWGSKDHVIPLEQSGRLQDAIKGSQLIVYDGVGHAPQEEASEVSLTTVRQFLSQKQ